MKNKERAKTQLIKLQSIPSENKSNEEIKDNQSEVSLKPENDSPTKYRCFHFNKAMIDLENFHRKTPGTKSILTLTNNFNLSPRKTRTLVSFRETHKLRIDSGGSLSPKKFGKDSNPSLSGFFQTEKAETLLVNSEIYTKVKEIGKGKQGKVYFVEEITTEKKFAIKAYCTSIQEEYGIYVQNEFSILNKLSHKNIIRVFEIIIGSKTVNLKLEFIVGETVKDLVHDTSMNGASFYSEAQILFIMKETLEGLEYLHANRIVHRDLNPGNIMVSPDFKCLKIIDFGLARDLNNANPNEELNTSFTPVGHKNYRSPEMLNQDTYSLTVDIWALGKILVEMLMGKAIGANKFGKILSEKKYREKGFSLFLCDLAESMTQKEPLMRIPACEALKLEIFK